MLKWLIAIVLTSAFVSLASAGMSLHGSPSGGGSCGSADLSQACNVPFVTESLI